MEFILELLKITLPALIVFFTVFYLMRHYIQGQLAMQRMKIQEEQQKISIPLRLQAYERLILLCERIALDQLLLRLRTREMKSSDLKNVLMIAVKQEYDHNLTQQLYVSDKLWEIISAAKDQLLDLIYLAARENPGDDPDAYSRELIKLYQQNNPLKTALHAIVKEGQMYF